MIISKKSFLFTTIAIALSIVIILSYRVYTSPKLDNEMKTIETRTETLNNFIKGAEGDIYQAIYIISYRSLLSIEDYMMANDDFINNLGTNLNNAFGESFISGTINSQKMALMENNTFLNWTGKIKDEANKTGISIDFTINSVSITQSSPWMVDVSVDLTINAKDTHKTASWAISRVFTGQINITGFVDPLYLVNNDGKVNNSINKTIVSDFGTGLPTHLLKSYYVEHSDAPSYLMRFENNLGASPFGIESLVNSQKIMDAGLAAKDRSAVDYIYFGTGSTTNCDIINFEAYEWFKLDNNHLSFYEATCSS